MDVPFTPEQEAQLAQIAINAGTDPAQLVKDAALRMLRDRDAKAHATFQGSVVDEMRAIRARVKPDPQGWTTRDYVRYGRN